MVQEEEIESGQQVEVAVHKSLKTMQQSAVNYKNFMGSKAFTNIKLGSLSRSFLPYLRPENEKLNMWSLLGKLFGQDLTKVSLPVILSEPLSSL